MEFWKKYEAGSRGEREGMEPGRSEVKLKGKRKNRGEGGTAQEFWTMC